MFHVEQIYKKLLFYFKQMPDFIIFLGLVFLLPFGTRRLLGTLVPYSDQVFNEWTSVFIYLTDIILVFLIIFWLRRLKIKKNPTKDKTWPLIIATATFLLIALASSFFSEFPDLSMYGVARYAGYTLLLIYTLTTVVSFKRRLALAFTILLSGLIQSLIGIGQFIRQSSLGLNWFGESTLSTEIDGVAEVFLAGFPVLRSYGTLPHPNVLAFLLMISLFLGIYLLFKVKNPYIHLFTAFAEGLIFTGLLLTFSRTAWLATIIGLTTTIFTYFLLKRVRSASQLYLPLKPTNKYKVWSSVSIFLLVAVGTTIALMPLLLPRLTFSDSNGDMAVSYRLFLQEKSQKLFLGKPALGIGDRTFVPTLALTDNENTPDWMYQPTHSLYWSLLAQLGILGFLTFLSIVITRLILKLHQIVPRGTTRRIYNKKIVPRGTISQKNLDSIWISLTIGIIIASLITGTTDHYILDVQQGSLLFWLTLGL